jgi:hypothetical protein
MWFILCLCSSHKRSKLLRWFKAFFLATDAEVRMMLSASLFSKEQGRIEPLMDEEREGRAGIHGNYQTGIKNVTRMLFDIYPSEYVI